MQNIEASGVRPYHRGRTHGGSLLLEICEGCLQSLPKVAKHPYQLSAAPTVAESATDAPCDREHAPVSINGGGS